MSSPLLGKAQQERWGAYVVWGGHKKKPKLFWEYGLYILKGKTCHFSLVRYFEMRVKVLLRYYLQYDSLFVAANNSSSSSILRIFWSTMNVAMGIKDAAKQMSVFMRLHFFFMA